MKLNNAPRLYTWPKFRVVMVLGGREEKEIFLCYCCKESGSSEEKLLNAKRELEKERKRIRIGTVKWDRKL